MIRSESGYGSGLSTTHADEVATKQHHHQEIDADGEPDTSEVVRSMPDNKANEHQLTEAGDSENQWADRRMICTVDQHPSNKRNQRSPVAYDNLGEWAFQRLAKRCAQGRLGRH